MLDNSKAGYESLLLDLHGKSNNRKSIIYIFGVISDDD